MRTKSTSILKTALLVTMLLHSGAFAQGTATTTTATDAAGNVTTTTKSVAPGVQSNISITQTPSQHTASTQTADALNNALVACQPFQSSMPHPMMKGFTITMQVYGNVGGKCKFTQTMPNNGLQTCLFSDQQRNEIKANGSKALEGFMMDENTCKISGY